MTEITWGWSVEDAADKLVELSGEAGGNGEIYALRTAQNTASAVERRRTAHRRNQLSHPLLEATALEPYTL